MSRNGKIALGAVQTLGAIAALIPKSRKLGLGTIAIGFLASSATIFATGNLAFALISLLPALLAAGLAWQSKP